MNQINDVLFYFYFSFMIDRFFLSNEKTNQRLVLSRPRLASWKHITFQTFFASVVKESNSECIYRVNKNEVHLKKRQTWQSFKCRKL